ncbi:MAG: pilus assembly protein PilM, partial [bacterium]|nr:pilus assembly protein PilM [bacterium]
MRGLHTYRLATMFPPPGFLSMPAAGIDISDTSIKYLDAAYNRAGYVPRDFDSMRLPRGIVVDGVVENKDALAEALKTLSQKHDRHFANISLPEELVYLYTIPIQSGQSDQATRQMVEFSLTEHVPILADNAVFDFDIISGENGVSEASVTVFPKDVIAGYKEACEKGGFHVKALELEAQSVARAVIPREASGTSMVIDFGRTRTGITIAKGQVPLFSTTVKVGGNALTEAIMNFYSVSEEKADEIKRIQGLAECKDEKLCALLLNTTKALTDEIRRHYRFWTTRKDEGGEREAVIEQIYLCGGAVG